MTCVYKENVDKIKMVEEGWLQLKMQVLLDYNKEIVSWWGETNLWLNIWWEGVYWRDFSIWEDEQIFG